MTYAENLVQLILDILNHNGTQAEMIEIAEEAMQAQREACASLYASRYITKRGTSEHKLWEAILNAEVQP